MATWWNKSGGLSYHYLGLRFRKGLWRDYREEVENFLYAILEQVEVKKEKLLLIGPSAAYTLPSKWLSEFGQIRAIDPDPLAPLFFRRVHGEMRAVWQREDYFLDSFGGWEKNGLYRLKTLYPDYIWFFSHLIGQLPLLIKNSRLEERDHWNSWRSHWQKGLEGIRWISLHDIFSARFSKVGKKMKTVYSSENLSKDEILKLVFAREDEIAVTDHLTYQLMPNTRNKRLLLWQLNPDQMQIIEATTNIEV